MDIERGRGELAHAGGPARVLDDLVLASGKKHGVGIPLRGSVRSEERANIALERRRKVRPCRSLSELRKREVDEEILVAHRYDAPPLLRARQALDDAERTS